MALAQELYGTSSCRLDSFVARWLQPSREWKEEVLEAVANVEQFLRQESFHGERWLQNQEARVLKVIKVGSFGTGTALKGTAEVELVAFLSCFCNFWEEAKYHTAVLRLIRKKIQYCQELLALGLRDLRIDEGVPSALVFTIQTRTAEPITVTLVPAYRVLGSSVSDSPPPPQVYVDLIKASYSYSNYPGIFSPSFSELQKNFVKHQPTKLKSLLRLVKHWYQQYVKAKCPRANLPPDYALELLTIYAWETGAEAESFRLEEGLATVMELLQDHQFLCIYWTSYYTLQDPLIEDCIRKQLKKDRPVILDPADPTHNVAEGYRWDILAQRAGQCLKQDCCYDSRENPVPSWSVKYAQDMQVTVEQWGYADLILWVNPYEPIRKLKERIRRSKGLVGLPRLSFQESGCKRQVLSSHCSLADYGVFCSTRICLLETVSPEIQVFVKSPNGSSQAYAVHPKSFVLNLKQQIEDRQGFLSKQQQLEYEGQVLQDWVDMGYYNIQDSDTITLSQKPSAHVRYLHS
ncbi:2'-5'-oligoadenylate synthase-like protein isoform X1 [Ochotona curzoniae]|uniref:2'-5'-oligoadenylate synthase-like protein isoform X1 n=1 Tax=Ochotona curzoniae TaxID=130825 RepID=UPI001B345AFD|nr:2'-5'-oligoadenylate synthase-like protein isoform X1 [Ochotona curzoniae]